VDAALYKGPSDVKKLLDDGADPNHGIDDYTPLMGAAEAGNLEAAQVLLSAGADPKRRTANRATPLTILARHNDNAGLAQLLVDAGTNPCERTETEAGRKNAFGIASAAGHSTVADYLRNLC
jgi:ankyrin repeat protein